MCGICGEVRFDGRPVSTSLIPKMTRVLKHRGPDDEGAWYTRFPEGGAALGHTRLAILDLTSAGRQPMWDASGRYGIVYNGEVYNFSEIRSALNKDGYLFKTATDTEVVLVCFATHGPDCLKMLNGMFAFALWDNRERKLFCARDRIGIKPFYYVWSDRVFRFASEIKALGCSPGPRLKPSASAVYDYLSLGIMHHGEETLYRGALQIPPGHWLTVDASGVARRRYWALHSGSVRCETPLDVEALQCLLEDSVRLQLRSDVPVGILLSGGLDSSAVTALASKRHPAGLKAFSLEFGQDGFDESRHAQLVAEHCRADLLLLKPKGKGLWHELDDLIRAQDAPTHAPEVYSNWCMMRAVAGCHVKVLLSGQGGDELFGGYNWYPRYFLASLLRRGNIGSLLSELIALPKQFHSNNTRHALILLGGLLYGLLPTIAKEQLKPEFASVDTILRPNFRKAMKPRDAVNLSMLDPVRLEAKMANDLMVNNLPQYLHYEDANSMAFGIEERVPLLDHRLVEWAAQLEIRWKFHRGISKYALRSAMNGKLPPEIIRRRDKMGLSAPREKWLREDLQEPIRRLFDGDCRIYDEWFDRGAFLSELNTYMQGKSTGFSRLLWRCINLEKWLQTCFA
jgi:asparagine synthase (glutamine-hydrolysing)